MKRLRLQFLTALRDAAVVEGYRAVRYPPDNLRHAYCIPYIIAAPLLLLICTGLSSKQATSNFFSCVVVAAANEYICSLVFLITHLL